MEIVIDWINWIYSVNLFCLVFWTFIFRIWKLIRILDFVVVVDDTWDRFRWIFLIFILIFLNLIHVFWRKGIFYVVFKFDAAELFLFENSTLGNVLSRNTDWGWFIKFIVFLFLIFAFHWWNMINIRGWIQKFDERVLRVTFMWIAP